MKTATPATAKAERAPPDSHLASIARLFWEAPQPKVCGAAGEPRSRPQETAGRATQRRLGGRSHSVGAHALDANHAVHLLQVAH